MTNSASQLGPPLQANTSDVLRSFQAHGLDDLREARLTDRIDTKYIVPKTQLPWLLGQLIEQYSVLEIGDRRIFCYDNPYLDTADRSFYRMHHQGKLNRHKVRYRRYVDTRSSFLEIKLKNNIGRTLKSRRPCPFDSQHIDAASEFLAEHLKPEHRQLEPSQLNSFRRIALASETFGERVTFDIDLEFTSPCETVSKSLPETCIAELKQLRRTPCSLFARLMRDLGNRPTPFSKYCIGTALTNPALKSNRFKRQMVKLTKLNPNQS